MNSQKGFRLFLNVTMFKKLCYYQKYVFVTVNP